MILVTGGAGFIGSNYVLDWIETNDEPATNLARLTYAGNRKNLSSVECKSRHHFVEGDVGESESEWIPAETFESGIRKTVESYHGNPEWVAEVQSGASGDSVQSDYQPNLRYPLTRTALPDAHM